jgi:hypothetical protein
MTIPHNLGRVPKVFGIWPTFTTTNAYKVIQALFVESSSDSFTIQISGSGNSKNDGTYTATEDSVTLVLSDGWASSVKFASGTYRYFVA